MTLERAVNRHVGRSTDNKPLDDPVGSRFFETDTLRVFNWDGSRWIDITGVDAQTPILIEIRNLIAEGVQLLRDAGIGC